MRQRRVGMPAVNSGSDVMVERDAFQAKRPLDRNAAAWGAARLSRVRPAASVGDGIPVAVGYVPLAVLAAVDLRGAQRIAARLTVD